MTVTRRIASKATTVRYTVMRSRLEAAFARHLDQMWEPWVYEPKVYGPKGRRYLPDFELTGAADPTFIEVKPTLAEVPAAKAKMAVIWDEEPNATLIVACAEGCTWFAATKGRPWETWLERWKHR